MKCTRMKNSIHETLSLFCYTMKSMNMNRNRWNLLIDRETRVMPEAEEKCSID